MDTALPILRRLSTVAILAGVTTTRGEAAKAIPRRSPGRPAVPVDKIVATALQIIDEEGADALSMRTLAQRLDSGTATLYRHFTNRGEVIAHVVDLVFGAVEFDAERLAAMSWQRAIKAAAQAMFDALRRHGNVAPLLVEELPIGPNAMAQRERFIALLLNNGFPPRLAARSYATLARYVLGFVIQVTGHTTAADLDDARLSAQFHGLDPNLFPATVTVADHLPVPLEDEFAFGLELIIDGLAQQLDRERRTTKSPRRARRQGGHSV